MKLQAGEIQAVFFDLDGTLVDSAPDLIAAMNRLRNELGETSADSAAIGGVVSKGARAMLRRGFPDADEARIEVLLPRFLHLYSEGIASHTRTYPGVDEVLARLEARHILWGIVTNKPGHLARAVVAELGLDARIAALVSGDCLPQRKPDPAPLLHASALAGVAPARSVYVGDDARDIQAGRDAGMMTLAAAWGYLDGEDPRKWGADAIVTTPLELLAALGLDEPGTVSENSPAFASFEQKWMAAYPEQIAIAVFLPAAQRLRASAFGCLVHELEQAAFAVREPQVIAAKLTWWRQELIDAANGGPHHPISTILFSDPYAQAVATALWPALADGAMAMLDALGASNLDALLGGYGALYTAIARIEIALFGGSATQQEAVATLWTISHLLRALPKLDEADERIPLPLDLLARHGLTRTMLARPGNARTTALRDYLGALGERTDVALASASSATLGRRVRSRLDLALIRKSRGTADPIDYLRRHPHAGRWRDLWLAWNEARHIARMR